MADNTNNDKSNDIVNLLQKLVTQGEAKMPKSKGGGGSYGERGKIKLPDLSTGTNTLTSQLKGSAASFGESLNKVTLGIGPILLGGMRSVAMATGGLFKSTFTGVAKLFSGDILGGLKDIFGGILDAAKNIVGSIAGMVNSILGNLWSLAKSILSQAFDRYMAMQKAVGNMAADIGLTRAESKGLLLNMTELTDVAIKYGGSMEDVTNMMQNFSDTTGKNKIFDKEDVDLIEKIGRSTALGIDGATELAAQFSNIGVSIKKVNDITNKATNEAAKLGLNSKKVLDSYSSLVNGLTGFAMKSGLENMTKLATQAVQLRMDLTGIAEKMSDAFFDPEGAVEAAAKMQVLGGSFADKFGDAFTLMFKAQNSPDELLKDLMDMTKGLATKNAQGIFYIPPAQMKLLKEAAGNLGVDFEQLKNGALEQAKLADKMGALTKAGMSGMFSDEDKQALANLVTFNDKDKQYYIKTSDGANKLLTSLTSKDEFESIIESRKKDEKAAQDRLNFMERLKIPLERIYNSFSQVFAEIFNKLEDSGFIDTVSKFTDDFINFIIPKIKDLFGDSGRMGKMLNDVIEKVKSISSTLIDIFSGKASFMDKIKEGIVALLKGVWDLIAPYLEQAMGNLLMSIGKATGFDSISRMGEKLLLDVDKNYKNRKGFENVVNPDEKNKYLGDIKEHEDDLSIKSIWDTIKGAKTGAIIGGAAGLAVGIGGAILSGGATIGTILPLMQGGAAVGAGIGGAVGLATSKPEPTNDALPEPTNDALMTPGGRVFKGGKGDIGVLFDQAGLTNNSGNSSGEIKHSGTITVRSEDGKEITINDLEKIGRYTLGTYINSITDGVSKGNSGYNNQKMPIAPIAR